MRALVFDNGVHLRDIPLPRPAKDEALIRVLSAGICNTDLELNRGYKNFNGVPGHEFVGLVEESSNPRLQGKRVVGEINCVCHTCRYCQIEMPHHCLNRSVLGILNRQGAFAEFVALPEENLHIVPDSIRDDVAVFTEPVAAAFRITEQIAIDSEDRIIVLGEGKLGQLVAQVLYLRSKHLVCVGRHGWKLEFLQKLHIATALTGEPVECGADVVVEATGSSGGLSRALELIKPERTIVLKTTVSHPTTLELSKAVINEVIILGSRCGPFRPALEALAAGSVEVRPMITETYGLLDGAHAMERAAAADVMKIVLHI